MSVIAPQLYSSLSEGCIRLLILLPGRSTSPLRCLLRTVNLLDFDDITGLAPQSLSKYEAVSYVWGDPTPCVHIDCNGFPLHITASLAEALQNLRYVEASRTLWADGICINQNDLAERAEQVKLMGLIYWKAQRTVVWLGRDEEDEERFRARNAIKLLHELIQLSNQNMNDEKITPDAMRYSRAAINRGDYADDWESLRRLLSRKWFQRVWVVQELGLAKEAVFYCGNVSIGSDDFEEALSYMRSKARLFVAYYDINLRMFEITAAFARSTRSSLRAELGSDPDLAETFLDILNLAKGLQCTDPRDTVYAFLGHPSAFKQHVLDSGPYMWYPQNYGQRHAVIQPDYCESTSVNEVYFRLAYTIIDDLDIGLELLCHIGHDEETIEEDDVPSWVPRWNIYEKTTFPRSAISSFPASDGLPPSPLKVKFDLDNLIVGLELQAYRLATVTFTAQLPWALSFEILPNMNTKLVWELRTDSDNPVADISAFVEELRTSLPNPTYNDLTSLAITLTAGLRGISDTPAQHLGKYMSYRKAKAPKDSTPNQAAEVCTPEDINGDDADQYLAILKNVAPRRTFFGTTDGRLGLGPRITRGGDQLWLPMGSKAPIVLRPHSEGRFKILGPAYLHGTIGVYAAKYLTANDFTLITLC